MTEVIGIDHIYIAVSDLERSELFYDRVLLEALGFRRTSSVSAVILTFNTSTATLVTSFALHGPKSHTTLMLLGCTISASELIRRVKSLRYPLSFVAMASRRRRQSSTPNMLQTIGQRSSPTPMAFDSKSQTTVWSVESAMTIGKAGLTSRCTRSSGAALRAAPRPGERRRWASGH